MIGEKDLAGDGECSRTKTSKPRFSQLNNDNHQDETLDLNHQKGVDFLNVRSNNLDGCSLKSLPRGGNKLTLSYLCENHELSGKIAESLGQKGKKVVMFFEDSNYDEKWIERDFFNLREINLNSSKQKAQQEEEEDAEEEQRRTTTSFSNDIMAPTPNAVKRSRVTMNNIEQRTTTSFSNDFTATVPSISYSYSHPFSHNISCSMNRNSTDFDCSVGKDDHIWCAGEGTNRSVHSRFRPIGDGGLALANNLLISGKPSSSSDYSFYPSELPARPGMEVIISGDSISSPIVKRHRFTSKTQ